MTVIAGTGVPYYVIWDIYLPLWPCLGPISLACIALPVSCTGDDAEHQFKPECRSTRRGAQMLPGTTVDREDCNSGTTGLSYPEAGRYLQVVSADEN